MLTYLSSIVYSWMIKKLSHQKLVCEIRDILWHPLPILLVLWGTRVRHDSLYQLFKNTSPWVNNEHNISCLYFEVLFSCSFPLWSYQKFIDISHFITYKKNLLVFYELNNLIFVSVRWVSIGVKPCKLKGIYTHTHRHIDR